ncbi:MAG: hypothetical protein J6B07_04555 [Opitutales bacterium]|nr:hypothetical protein [Opitutales bacterium]
MVEIKLKNGSIFNLKSIQLKGCITDSNGLDCGGETTIIFIESEVNSLNEKLGTMGFNLQAINDIIIADLPQSGTPNTKLESEDV